MATTLDELKLVVARVESSQYLADMVSAVKRFYGPTAASARADVGEDYNDEDYFDRVFGFEVYDAEGNRLEKLTKPESEEEIARCRQKYEEYASKPHMKDWVEKYYPTFEKYLNESEWMGDQEYEALKNLNPEVGRFGLVNLNGDLTPPDLSKLTLVWEE